MYLFESPIQGAKIYTLGKLFFPIECLDQKLCYMEKFKQFGLQGGQKFLYPSSTFEIRHACK